MSETTKKITNLNSILIEICHHYQAITAAQFKVLGKVLEITESDEIKALLYEQNESFKEDLEKINNLLVFTEQEFNVTISKVH